MSDVGLTARQHELLTFIVAYIGRHQRAPTYRECAAAMKVGSKASVHRLVAGLEARGYVSTRHSAWRTMNVLKAPASVLEELLAVVPDAVLMREVDRRACKGSDAVLPALFRFGAGTSPKGAAS